MAYKFTFTDRFKKSFKPFTDTEKKQILNKLKLLADNPSHPSIRVKRIQGTADLFECSVNMDIRIIWYFFQKIGAPHITGDGYRFVIKIYSKLTAQPVR